MKGDCVRGCNPSATFYTFKVYKNELDFNFQFDEIIWQEFNITDQYFVTNYTSNTIQISSLLFHAYENTTYWKVMLLTDTIIGNQKKSGTGVIILKTNETPYNGSCIITTNTTGYALESNFTVFCYDWMDSDGYITSYEFYGK